MARTTSHPPTLVVVLAAGAGTRYDGPTHKLSAPVDGTPVIEHAVRAAIDASIGPVVVVTGAFEPDLDAFGDELAAGRLEVIENPEWQRCQSSSLLVAVAEAERRHAHAIVVGLGDQPFVTPQSWAAVAASRSPIAAADYGDGPRNPVRLHHSVWPLLPREGDQGARPLIRLRPELVERVPCEGSPADIDTLEDLHSWQNRSSTNSR